MAGRKTEFVSEAGKPTVVMTRVFDAPRRLVFQAMTTPEYVKRWYGPHGFEVPFCEIDLRPGGAYRIVNRAPDGSEFGFRGVYKEVEVPARLVYTWIFEPLPDKEAVVTDLFEEKQGTTTVTSTTHFGSVADRDAFVATGGTEGGAQSMERVEELLRTMT
jgi:uncharacterized protein YndB with AHSA1/START domain